MEPKLNYQTVSPEAVHAVYGLEKYIQRSGIDNTLTHLIRLRASQINGCAFCIDMHTKEAKQDGESEQRLHLVSVWRDSPLFSDRERAVLSWTESLTQLDGTSIQDDEYEHLKQHFSEDEIVQLTIIICSINVWNRLNIGFGIVHQ